ncbi:AraC-like ligand-binding domain-containing protein [Microbacterium sp. NPDC055683]
MKRPVHALHDLGITFAGARGRPTVFRFAGQAGLDQLSIATTADAPEPHLFRARVLSVPLEQIAVEEICASSAFRVERTAGHVALFPVDVVRVSYIVEGTLELSTATHRLDVEAGQIVVIRMSEPFAAAFDGPSRHLTVVVPTRLLQMECGGILPASNPLAPSAAGGMFRAMLTALAQTAPDDNTVESEHLARAVVGIVRALAHASGRRREAVDPAEEIRARARGFVDRRYRDPRLTAEGIARSVPVSPRHLARLFDGEPETIAQRIRRRRTTALAAELRGSREPFPVLAAECGFGSADAAYRALRAIVGMTPTEVRATGATDALPDESCRASRSSGGAAAASH